MIVDASTQTGLDLLRQATATFARADQVAAFLEEPAALAFVALDDADEVIGWCWGYRLARPEAPPMLYLHELEVAEERRRKGHGRALLEAFMAAGRTAGATKMFLLTAEANQPARRLYESMGGGLAAHGPTANYWFRFARPRTGPVLVRRSCERPS